MYPKVVQIDGSIELVQNSGVQFVDLDAMVEWKSKDRLSKIRANETGYFMRYASSAGSSKEEPLVRLVPKISDEITYVNPLNGRAVDTSNATITESLADSLTLYNGVWFPIPYIPEHLSENQYGPINWVRARVVKVTDPEAISQWQIEHGEKAKESPDAVDYHEDGVSPAPVPVADGSGAGAGVAGVAGVASAPSKPGREERTYYRVVLAFDTQTQDNNDMSGYFAPTDRDVESGVRFFFAYTADRCHPFLKPVGSGLPWVREWAESVFKDLYKERLRPKALEEEINELVDQHCHEAHYLNMLAFLGELVNPQPVHFIANQNHTRLMGVSNVIDVSLILDIGNSRSCGIMVEDHPSVVRSDDNFKNTYCLKLRDLNSPEIVYDEPFASRIEFSKPNFDYNNRSARSGRPDAFNWPSMVRVGTEASNLADHLEGNEGNTGLISPKRYLWSTDRLTGDQWIFNSFSYLIDSPAIQKKQKGRSSRAFLNTIGSYFNTDGKAYFALDADDTVYDNLESYYSYRSTMTFMLIEIILQAMVQMNSVGQRANCNSRQSPRRLKAIILTTPPSMPPEEKELYRACIYEAIGILWKALGFDTSSPREFKFGEEDSNIVPPVPEVKMDWNEAEAGQVVYIYNESQKTFQGDIKAFISNLRRPMMPQRLAEHLVDSDQSPLLSARIASLDIGGGTTDLVIKDYTFKRDEAPYSENLIPHEILKDGVKIAGDDIIHNIIKSCIITRLAFTLVKSDPKLGRSYKSVLQKLVGDDNVGNVRTERLRSCFTQQILVKIAYKILFHMEHLDPYATSCKISGTVRDYILDRERNDSLDVTVKRPGPMAMPSEEVVNYVDNIIGERLRGFSILDYKLSFDVAAINRELMQGTRFDITRVLFKFAEVITAFDCDLLILTGRSSKLPAIRSFFMQRLNMPASRIIQMHRYRCEEWYPFSRDGDYIADPKTTASVGALLCYLRLQHAKFPNFRYYSYPEDTTSNAHYVGIINNQNRIDEGAVLYKYESARMVARKNISDEEDEESNFVPYKRDSDEFKTTLSVELGYRLLDDPMMEATPLFKIEAYNSVDEIKPIKQAQSLTYTGLSRTEVEEFLGKLDEEVQAKVGPRIRELLTRIENGDLGGVNGTPSLSAYRAQLEDALRQRVTNEVNASYVEPKKGLFSGLFGGKDDGEAEKQAQISAKIAERYQSEVEELCAEFANNARYEVENELCECLNNAIEDNVKFLHDMHQRKFDALRRQLDVDRVQFEVTLRTVNRNSPYPLKFIKDQLQSAKNRVKQVESFELESVRSETGDYTKYFKMYLKTISGAKVKYFMDSGTIDLNGINPKYRL